MRSTESKRKSMEKSVICPSCKKFHTEKLSEMTGSIGYISMGKESYLFSCYNCRLLFRWPYLEPKDLIHQYSKISAKNWENNYRIDQEKILNFICHKFSSGRILDVGCFRGDFLGKLPKSFSKFGIEPSHEAREIARSRGIELIGTMLEKQRQKNVDTFDVITAIDLIEHIQDPLSALRQISSLLKKDGYLIVSTGNTNALTWRLLRENYWYYFTEHVSFTNPEWFRWAGNKLSMVVEQVMTFAYYRGTAYIKMKQLIMAICYRFYQEVSRYNKTSLILSNVWPFTKVATWTTPPVTRMWPDHMIIILRKKQSG